MGQFKKAFAKNLGDCSAVQAELWAIFLNLNVAHEKGFNAIFIESDSLLSVSLVCGVYLRTHPCFNLIEDICTGMKRFRVVHLKHIWWEANQVANKLAKNGLWLVIFVFFILLLLSRFLYWQCNFCSLPSWVLI